MDLYKDPEYEYLNGVTDILIECLPVIIGSDMTAEELVQYILNCQRELSDFIAQNQPRVIISKLANTTILYAENDFLDILDKNNVQGIYNTQGIREDAQDILSSIDVDEDMLSIQAELDETDLLGMPLEDNEYSEI